ncbi:MAG: hypothetical protein PUA69_03170 [Erysipelotrichaceae bacterium]|nr:hypothetical protein [Erysipelotrichaceae bacterium]
MHQFFMLTLAYGNGAVVEYDCEDPAGTLPYIKTVSSRIRKTVSTVMAENGMTVLKVY